MEFAILSAIVILILLVGMLIWKVLNPGSHEQIKLESLISEKLNQFSDKVRDTMDNTRREVERSKDAVSSGTIKTLEHLNQMNKVVSSLVQQQEKAEELGKSLEYLLQSPKLRGNYGETVLEEMLDKILPKGIWERQYSIEGGEKVDAVVKYKNVVIPIDSKFPKEDYQKYLAASSDIEKKAHWANYEKALKVQINSIKEKYIKPEHGTTEFALLFIPSEAIYYETIAEKNFINDPCQIYEYASDRKVIPVSPNTFYAFLNVIILGIRNIEIAQETRKLQGMLTKVERDFSFFFNNFETIGKAIEKASKSYDTGKTQVIRFKKNLDSALNFEIVQKTDENMIEQDNPEAIDSSESSIESEF